MKKYNLHIELKILYKKIKTDIILRLNDFKNVPSNEYFYELCYCLCTPQSKAKNAYIVQTELMKNDYFNNLYDIVPLLAKKENYIRFHNQKAIRIKQARNSFSEIAQRIESDMSAFEKRLWLAKNVKGLGLKESSHFLRNIGYDGLAILDRHIFRELYNCGVIEETKVAKSPTHYFAIEEEFKNFARFIEIPMEHLDVLFWSKATGEILK